MHPLTIDPAFWRGRQVFVTGHTGFKGSWLCAWLARMGAKVHGFALPPYGTPNVFDAAKIGTKVDDVRGDIRDAGALQAALHRAKPEIVLHLAAQALIKTGYDDPITTYGSNVMGTAHLLNAVRTCPTVRAVVVVTSDKVYENKELPRGYREDDTLGGFDPYSSSKACTEHVAAAFRNSYFPAADYKRHGVAIATARAGNVIGGGDWAENRLIPDIMRAFSVGQELIVRSPTAVRPWQHVLEPLSGYLMLARGLIEAGPTYAEGWNFGPDIKSAQPVIQLVEYIAGLWPNRPSWNIQPSDFHETHFLHVDSTKARQRMGWRAALDLHKALDFTTAWYLNYYAKKDVAVLLDQQIDAFMKLFSAAAEAPVAHA